MKVSRRCWMEVVGRSSRLDEVTRANTALYYKIPREIHVEFHHTQSTVHYCCSGKTSRCCCCCRSCGC